MIQNTTGGKEKEGRKEGRKSWPYFLFDAVTGKNLYYRVRGGNSVHSFTGSDGTEVLGRNHMEKTKRERPQHGDWTD